MKKLIIITLLTITATPLFADGVRCKSYLINSGDSKAKVLQRCGQPISSEIIGYQKKYKNNERIESPIEELTYSFDKGSYHILRFENGKLTTVTLER